MFLFGPPNIDKLKTKGNVEGLIAALNYKKDPTIRRDAAKALGEMGDSRAVEPLIEIARSSDGKELRMLAIDSLGKLGDPRAVEPLLALLSSSSSVVYPNAEKALKNIGSPAVAILITTLSNSDRRMRNQAAKMLTAFLWEPRNTIEKASIWIARREFNRLMELDYHSIKPLLIQSLKWDSHPDDFHLNIQLARFILKSEHNLDDPIVTLANTLLEISIGEYPKALDKILAAQLWLY